jgi:hypothetical protein
MNTALLSLGTAYPADSVFSSKPTEHKLNDYHPVCSPTPGGQIVGQPSLTFRTEPNGSFGAAGIPVR